MPNQLSHTAHGCSKLLSDLPSFDLFSSSFWAHNYYQMKIYKAIGWCMWFCRHIPGPRSCKFKALVSYDPTPTQFPSFISSFGTPTTPMYSNPRSPLWLCAFLSSCPFSSCSCHTCVCPTLLTFQNPTPWKYLLKSGWGTESGQNRESIGSPARASRGLSQ